MELGTGIFLSAVFLGIVALYIATKDRWNWKKILLWPLAVVVVLSSVGGIVAYAYKKYEERPKVQVEFNGIKLGDQFQDVVFRHGKLERLSTQFVRDIGKALLEKRAEKGTSDYAKLEVLLEWWKKEESEEIAKGKADGDYEVLGNRVTIAHDKVEKIIRDCKADSLDFSEVNGIRCDSDGEDIIGKFGSDVRVLCEKEPDSGDAGSVMRVYDVVKYGTRYYLAKNKVKAMMITTPSALETYVGINWVKCS